MLDNDLAKEMDVISEVGAHSNMSMYISKNMKPAAISADHWRGGSTSITAVVHILYLMDENRWKYFKTSCQGGYPLWQD